MSTHPPEVHEVTSASTGDTLAALGEVLGPTLAKGVIIRRPGVLRVADRLDADHRAVQRMQALRATYGPGPVQLNVPGRTMALVLDPDDVKRVLAGAPEPFAPASMEKRAALSHFQPEGVLASHGHEREDRRAFNEQVLESDLPVHHLAEPLLAKVDEEAAVLAEQVARDGRLTWPAYIDAWMRMVRRVVLGDAARDDHALTDLLADLRAAANFAFLHPKRRETRRRFLRQLQGHLDRAEPDSLAGVIATTPTTGITRPEQQVPQWLFAYDAASWASYRALALLGTHTQQATEAREDLAAPSAGPPGDSEYLRACVLESLRLWPTTPVVLRDTTEPTEWASGTLPAGASLMIFAPLFHRDDSALEAANRFEPAVWTGRTGGAPLGRITDDDWPLIPFSAGPAVCPGRNLVLLTASAMLAGLLTRGDLRLEQLQRLRPDRPLPGSLSPFHLSFGRVGPGWSRG
jgi:cytochrome P450